MRWLTTTWRWPSVPERALSQLDWFQDANDVDAIAQGAVVPMAVAWIVGLTVVGSYAPTALGAGTTEYRKVLTASALTGRVIGVGCYLLRYPLSRGLFFLTFLIGVPLLLLGRHVLRRVIHRVHERGGLLHSVVLVGA